MKLRTSKTRATQMEGRIGPYAITVGRGAVRGHWWGVIATTPKLRHRVQAQSLAEVKKQLVRRYVGRRLNLLHERFRDRPDFDPLYRAAHPFSRRGEQCPDPMAVSVLLDWLMDAGEEKEARLFADEGKKAGIKAEEWPEGWADAVARFAPAKNS